MRTLLGIILLLATSLSAEKTAANPQNCSANATCGISKKDLKQAHRALEHAQKLQKEGNLVDALQAMDEVVRLVPRNLEYLTTRETIKQELVSRHIDRAGELLTAGKRADALTELQAALRLDPDNDLAKQRVLDAMPPSAGASDANKGTVPDAFSEAQPIVLAPSSERLTIHFRGSSRDLLQQICNAFGIKPVFDDSVRTRAIVQFDLEDVGFNTAMDAASKLSKVLWFPVSAKEVLFADDTPEQHRLFDRMVLQTFYLSSSTTPQELQEIATALRSVLNLRLIQTASENSSLSIRASQSTVEAAEKLLPLLTRPKPEVMLDLQAFQISHTLTEQLGVNLPLQWQVINLPSSVLALLENPQTSDLINQLFNSGGINQANSAAIQALLAQAQSQSQNPLLNTPFATFGGGLTRFAIPFPPASIQVQLNESTVRDLQRLSLRASLGNAATMRIGSRIPILNTSFAPIFNSAQVSQVLANQTFIPPFPSFNYEDIGITVKATPLSISPDDVSLKLELQVRAVTAQTVNGIPVLSNREYVGNLSLKNGEPGFVAGILTQSEQRNLQGVPGLHHVPLISQATTLHNLEHDTDELMVVIVPRIVSRADTPNQKAEIWLPTASR